MKIGTSISSSLRVMRCSAANAHFCLDMDWVLSVERPHKLHAVPERPELTGYLLFVGERVDVYPAGPMLGAGRNEPMENGAVVIVQDAERRWGLLVDRVYHAMPLPLEHLSELPPSLQRFHPGLYRGTVHLEGESRLLLAPHFLHPAVSEPEPPAMDAPGARFAWRPGQHAEPSRPGRIQTYSLLNEGLGNPLQLALSATQVVELVDDPVVVPLPGTPGHYLGALDWRGVNVAVIDAGRLIGLPPIPDGMPYQVLVARAAGATEPCGIPVGPDAVEHELPVPLQARRSSPALDESYALGVVDTAAATLYVPDLARMLAA